MPSSLLSVSPDMIAGGLTRIPAPEPGRLDILQAPEAPHGLESPSAAGPVAPAFGEILNQFLDQVDQAQHKSDDMVESLALGEPVDVHQVMLALSEASNALNLTLQVRGKLLEAYQELMRVPL
jgi:flagellar hook-basal body complex protein FliE